MISAISMLTPLQGRKPNLPNESNHDGTKQDMWEQERFVQTEITLTLRKNGSYMPSSLGGKSFPMVKQAGRQTKISLFNKI